MGIRTQSPQIQLALQELERQLKEAVLYAHQYNKGWDHVPRLQSLYRQYQEAAEQAPSLQKAKVSRQSRLAA